MTRIRFVVPRSEDTDITTTILVIQTRLIDPNHATHIRDIRAPRTPLSKIYQCVYRSPLPPPTIVFIKLIHGMDNDQIVGSTSTLDVKCSRLCFACERLQMLSRRMLREVPHISNRYSCLT